MREAMLGDNTGRIAMWQATQVTRVYANLRAVIW
jgi:hypothetical protein